MKRLVFALTTGVLSALLLVAPASAQTNEPGYGGNPGGCSVEDPPPDTAPPCLPRAAAEVADPEVRPGDPITVTTPPVFAPGSAITVNIVRANNTAQPGQLATGTAASDGRVSNTSTVPDLPPGVYFVYVTGTGPDGNPVVALVPIVVRAAETAAAAQGSAESTAFQAASAPVPAQVAEIQSNLTADTEAAIVEAVAAGDAGLLVSPEGQLNVRTAQGVQQASSLPTTGSDGIATQVAVGAALLLAGTGLVLMRRKGFVK